MNNKYICIHGHFYQPPRENPWLESVELQDSAYPYHDWNARITAECYAPNSASRIVDGENKIITIENNYSRMSFNFGPTLLSWMESHRPDIHNAVIAADVESRSRFSGHGSAIAQCYSHLIMPLANYRDKYTQVVWGIKDFQKRFKRFPEGMWLPETAVDTETLEIMAGCGIKFTILSPHQAQWVRPLKPDAAWIDVSGARIDPRIPYLCTLPSGKAVSIFFYDGPVSHDLAFGNLLMNGENFAKRLLSAFSNNGENGAQLVHIATDGETYGHHHRFGDMALGYCLNYISSKGLARLTNYPEYLETHPPQYEVKIFDNSSWSCIHGIERWRDNCGCNSGMNPSWGQEWRKPLREAMDMVRDMLIPVYEKEASSYLRDPWAARNAYIDVLLDRSKDSVERFFSDHAVRGLSRKERSTALKLLEMQRNAMLMFTSCGWFFDEISGLEATQVMRYTSRALQLAEELTGAILEPEFVKYLGKARSNIPEFSNGAKVYDMFVKPVRIDFLRVAAHYAIFSLFDGYPKNASIHCYSARSTICERQDYGKSKLFVGNTEITSNVTLDSERISFAVLHLGDQNINGGVSNTMNEETFTLMHKEVRAAFDKGDILETLKFMERYFGSNNYSLWHLFKDEQREALGEVMRPTMNQIENSFRRIYNSDYSIMNYFQSLGIPLPKCLLLVARYMVNHDLIEAFETADIDTGRLKGLVDEVLKWPLRVDKMSTGFAASTWIERTMEHIEKKPHDIAAMEKLLSVIKLMKSIDIQLNLWKAQNTYFFLKQSNTQPGSDLAGIFEKLGEELGFRVLIGAR